MNISQKTAELLLKIKAISLQPNTPFKYSSGMLSPIYIDNRIISSFVETRKKIINFFIETMKTNIGLDNIDLLSGTATGAISHAAFISQKLDIPMVYVRGKAKGHGKQNQVEGVVKKNQKTLVIEDLISTGNSLINNAIAIRKKGGKVKYALAITTYLLQKSIDNFKKNELKVYCLTNINDIVDIAEKKGYIAKKDRSLVLDWARDPQNWAKKNGFK